ncbi:MAG: FMN-binding protein [Knoellia sp.]
MRRITLWIASTATMLVLLFSYHTSTSSGTTTSISSPANNGSVAAAGSSGSSGSSDSGSSGTTSSSSKAYTGDAASTRFGDVQVQITVADGRITTATVTQVPWQDHRDQEINSRAVPILTDETVSAQSADIDMVSGATYTSEGYVESLQSALDQAGL